MSGEKGGDYGDYDDFLGAYGDISEKKFSDTIDNQDEILDFDEEN